MPEFQIPDSKPPLKRTYWVVEGNLLAGAYAGQPDASAHRKRLSGLFHAGVRTFVNLMEEDEVNNVGKPFVPYGDVLQSIASDANDTVSCQRFPIVDQNITTNEHMVEILDTIDRSIDNGHAVYVHCFGGIGRTGTVVCCWLLRHGYATKRNVFEVLRQLRMADTERSSRRAPENETQRDFVLNWPEPPSSASSNASAKKSFPPARRSDWFTELMGFSERTPAEVREHITQQDDQLTSKVNGKTYQAGRLEVITVGELRQRAQEVSGSKGWLRLEELVGDVRTLHTDPSNAGALFQVASQFNLLEMVSPNVTPEQGVGIYENDPTQGPACAVACGAGTIFRNYFVPLEGQIGQSENCQVDCLSALGEALGNTEGSLWDMRNGYALPSAAGLEKINERLGESTEDEVDALRASLRVGIQWNTEVTLEGGQHLVSQIYCSAMPVAYSELPSSKWERLSCLILEAAYEATLAAAAINAAQTENNTVYLTLLGGGAFGNDQTWILSAIERACHQFQHIDLDVKIVSHRSSNSSVQERVSSFARQSIINRLDDGSRVFPTDAIEAARKRPSEMIPSLIRLIEDAAGDCKQGKLDDHRNGHFYAAYLLTEFRATESWPTIRNAISLPDEMPFDLFGDTITESLGCMISTLTENSLETIDELIADRSLHDDVRGSACEAILYCIRDGLMTRDQGIVWISKRLEHAIGNGDKVAEGLVDRLERLGATQAMPLIEKAYESGLVDEDHYPLDEIKEEILLGDEFWLTLKTQLPHPETLIEVLQSWADFGDDDDDLEADMDATAYEASDFSDVSGNSNAYEPSIGIDSEPIFENETTVRNEHATVGRNEKCPCGSGKKYKKCCGRTSNRAID